MVFAQVNLDKLYVLAVNHVFKKSLLPLVMEQAKQVQHVDPSREMSTVTQNIFGHVLCIQNLELAAATVYKIAQDLPAGETLDVHFIDFQSYARSSIREHVISRRFIMPQCDH